MQPETLHHCTASLTCPKHTRICIFASLWGYLGEESHILYETTSKKKLMPKPFSGSVWFSQLSVSDPVSQTTHMALKSTCVHKCIERVLIASSWHSLAYEGNVEGFPPILFPVPATPKGTCIIPVNSSQLWLQRYGMSGSCSCIDPYGGSGAFAIM